MIQLHQLLSLQERLVQEPVRSDNDDDDIDDDDDDDINVLVSI